MLRRLAVAAAIVAAVAAELATFPIADVGGWAPDLAVALAFIVAAAAISTVPGGSRMAALAAAVAATWLLAGLVAPLAFLYRAVLLHAALGAPRGRLRTWPARAVVAVAYVLVLHPATRGDDTVALALAGAALAVGGARRPARIAVLAGAAPLALAAVAHLVLPSRADRWVLLAFEASLCVAAAALVHVAGPRAGSRRVADMVVDLGPDDAVSVLVRAEPDLVGDPSFHEAVAAAERLLATNRELGAQLEERIDELAASRRRLLTAEERERAALEDRLQHGPGGRLDGVLAAVAGLRTDVPAARERLDAARQLAADARVDLARVARGLFPAAVADGSLESALHAIAAASPVPVTIDLVAGQVDPDVAPTVYFVCAEAVANAVKHAAATRISIRVAASDDVVVEVDDDGCGGAGAVRSLDDRLQAVGGRLTVTSPPGGGTRIVARLPQARVVS